MSTIKHNHSNKDSHEHNAHGHNHHHDHDHCCSPSETPITSVQLNKVSNAKVSTFTVSGMDCADEIAAIQKSLNDFRVAKVTANLMSSQVIVEHAPTLETAELIQKINSAGVKVIDSSKKARNFFEEQKNRILLVALSGFTLTVGLLLDWTDFASAEVLFSLFLISTLSGGYLVVPKGYRALKQKNLDMNVLMTLAVIGAFIIREYAEAAAVVFLFSLAELLEAFSVSRARKAIREVLSITPQTANVERESQVQAKPVEEVQIGEIIVVLSGESIPIDGEVISGSSSVNQAPLTGESQPVSKSTGDAVYAGTINESGTLRIKVSRVFAESKISNVIKLIEEAQSKKAPAQKFVDRFARIYTPVVTVVALLTFVIPPLFFAQDWNLWFYRALVFLVIACPCALVIATPVSIVSALTALAKNGVLVKGGVYLESLGKLKAIALDKTGTITEGTPKVVTQKIFKSGSDSEFLNAAASLENESTHPLAKATLAYAKTKSASVLQVSYFKTIHGQGIEGQIGDHLYFAGNHKLTHSLGICTPELESYLSSLEDQAHSVLIVGHKPHNDCKGEVLGVLSLSDEPRHQVKESISALHGVGINEIAMLSGDNQRTVTAVAKKVGIDSAKGDLLPEDKVSEIQKLLQKHKYVGMVGDGINDAPALAGATIGIAMGAVGTDAAIETADVALMTDDLKQLEIAIGHGKKTLSIIHFNIGFALLTKAIFIVLGIAGYSSLWLAVAADMGATLLVIANSVRLLQIKKG